MYSEWSAIENSYRKLITDALKKSHYDIRKAKIEYVTLPRDVDIRDSGHIHIRAGHMLERLKKKALEINQPVMNSEVILRWLDIDLLDTGFMDAYQRIMLAQVMGNNSKKSVKQARLMIQRLRDLRVDVSDKEVMLNQAIGAS